MLELIKKTAIAGLGAAVLTQEKIESVIGELVKKGEMKEDVGQKLVRELIEKGEDSKKEAELLLETTFQMIWSKMNVATRTDLDHLQQQIDQLKETIGKTGSQ